MPGQLITLPLRLGVRAARGAMGTGLQLTGRAVALAGQLAQSVRGGGASAATDTPSPESRPGAKPDDAHAAPQERPSRPPARPKPRERKLPPRPAAGEVPVGSRPTSAPTQLEDLPAHVSTEPELVGSFAEPGAEDGAGAEVTMDQPWEGYDQMPAKDLIVRLGEADPAELAAVKLYESATRSRETVLTAVDREFQGRQST